MDANSRREFLADMRGQGRTVGNPNIVPWYFGWRNKMDLHPDTRNWIEERITSHLTPLEIKKLWRLGDKVHGD